MHSSFNSNAVRPPLALPRHRAFAFRRYLANAAVVIVTLTGKTAWADEIGHYTPGVMNVRDFAMPSPGLYGLVYSYYYHSDRLNNADGDAVRSLTVSSRSGQRATLNVELDLDVLALAPMMLWVSPFEIAGARYGAYIMPTFANTSLGAAVTNAFGAGRSVDAAQFNVGDLFVQPLWLDWSLPNWDIAIGYGLYVPIGRYQTETLQLPSVGSIRAESPDNIGFGFWTHQFQTGVSFYPWADRRMAVVTGVTYEIHHRKEDFDLTPGHNLTINWGLSQYLPLKTDKSLLLELGANGYSSFQITEDSGSDAHSAGTRDQVHAAGGQLGLSYRPWMSSLNLHYFHEFAAKDRFQGNSVSLNLAVKMWPGEHALGEPSAPVRAANHAETR